MITEIKITPLLFPLIKPFSNHIRVITHITGLEVRIVTTIGIIGHGFIYGLNNMPHEEIINDTCWNCKIYLLKLVRAFFSASAHQRSCLTTFSIVAWSLLTTIVNLEIPCRSVSETVRLSILIFRRKNRSAILYKTPGLFSVNAVIVYCIIVLVIPSRARNPVNYGYTET